ncbi:MAG: hypothetical protein CL878_14230, partial [Dehalococcoidia bacterium]|nr:hypothetical protein [Dehalococcoidia bacterium]
VVERGGGPAVVCGEGVLALDQVQLEGRRQMAAPDFLRGQRALVGAQLSDRPSPQSAGESSPG